MSRLLIIGASILQLPAIRKAKELGHYVAVADYNPQAIGIPYADIYFNASTIDEEAIFQVAQNFHPDGILTLATDMPMRSIAMATSKLGLPGITPQTAIKATDKGEMIIAFKAHGVESPGFYILKTKNDLNNICKKLTYPCIIKPTDNSGSRGVILVNKELELDQGFIYSKSHSRQGVVIIEEYMQGPEVSVEVLVLSGVVHILAVTDKLTTGVPYFVEMGHSQQSQLGVENVAKIKDLASRAVKAIGIENGAAHVEIMLTKDGPKMVELGARLGGDCITTHLVPLSTGIDMVKATIDVALNTIPCIDPLFDKGSAIRYFKVPNGIISSIEGYDEALQIEGIKEITFIKNAGDLVSDIKSSTDRIGFVVAQGNTANEAIDRCEKAIKKVKITVKQINENITAPFLL